MAGPIAERRACGCPASRIRCPLIKVSDNSWPAFRTVSGPTVSTCHSAERNRCFAAPAASASVVRRTRASAYASMARPPRAPVRGRGGCGDRGGCGRSVPWSACSPARTPGRIAGLDDASPGLPGIGLSLPPESGHRGATVMACGPPPKRRRSGGGSAVSPVNMIRLMRRLIGRMSKWWTYRTGWTGRATVRDRRRPCDRPRSCRIGTARRLCG